MPRVRVEFTVEPFTEGVLGPHVTAALDAVRAAGFEPDIDPFGNAVDGEAEAVLPAVAGAAVAAFAAGATGLSITTRTALAHADDVDDFLRATRAVAQATGARVVDVDEMNAGDVPLTWRGEVVGGLRTPTRPADQGLGVLVSEVESEVGGPLAELARADKQRAVRLLDERGAFSFRNAVDEVADTMGVSRVTVYNYLNATRSRPAPAARSS